MWDHLRAVGAGTTAELATAADLNRNTVKNLLRRYAREGLVSLDGEEPGAGQIQAAIWRLVTDLGPLAPIPHGACHSGSGFTDPNKTEPPATERRLSDEPALESAHNGTGKIVLSGKQIHAADRIGGGELLIPWPAHLPAPRLSEDEERDATAAEEEWVRAQLGDLMVHDLVCVRVQAVVIRRPSDVDLPNKVLPHLSAIIIGRRWVHARTKEHPRMMWARPHTA
ncbi:MAG: hypothetical protein HQL38_03130 [Alphaproteobacteria bacterium]|nr:hypothetical protein [Alphaproteobacteria bacterium]